MDIKKILLKIRRSVWVRKGLQLFYAIARFFPVQKKAVMFESFLGKQYSGNPKAIYQYMKEHYPDHDLYWSMDRAYRQRFRGEEINGLTRFGPKWLYVMATARYWVTNTRLPLWMKKPKHTVYVQTWHGTPLKKLGADIDEVHMPGTDTHTYKQNFMISSGKWDYLVSPNPYSTAIFRQAFRFGKTVIESGYPRNDILIQSNTPTEQKRLKQKLGLPLDKKVILYAPTWRDDDYYSTGKYKFDLQLDLKKMKEELGDEFVVLLRMHYLISGKLDISEYTDFVTDVSASCDINALYLVSDVLITDYSSVFFDFANLRRPIIFFVYDLEEYRDTLRGFYLDIEREAPGPLARTTEDVIDSIKDLTHEEAVLPEVYDTFIAKFCSLEDGHASERVVEKMLGDQQ